MITEIKVSSGTNSLHLFYDPKNDAPVRLQDMLCALEMEILKHMLVQHKGVKARAARALSLLRTTLVEKCKKYDITI